MRLIWVYGLRGSGKKTAILDIANYHKESTLRDELDIDFPVIPIVAGLGANKERFRYLEECIGRLSGVDATLLIHGQRCDFDGFIQSKLGECVYLMPKREEYLKRCNKRGIQPDTKKRQDKEIKILTETFGNVLIWV